MKTSTAVRHRAIHPIWGLVLAVGTAWPLASQAEDAPIPDAVAAPPAAAPAAVEPAAPVSVVAVAVSPAPAASTPAPVPPAATPRKPTRFAIGASFGFLRRHDVGREIDTLFVPSIVGLAYFRIAPRVYLRPGLRLGLMGFADQPDAASDARIEERGILGRAEVGILYDAWLVPALSMGAGLERRRIEFVGTGIAQPSSLANRTELLGHFYGQFGVGLPLFHGFMVIEPYVRILHVFADDRANSELGFDVTFAL